MSAAKKSRQASYFYRAVPVTERMSHRRRATFAFLLFNPSFPWNHSLFFDYLSPLDAHF
jgi:hypothetical protein